jgi:N-methylhydantoinase A
LITTAGFKDILQIARQNRPELYDWNVDPPTALVPPHLRMEVKERIDYQGQVLHPLDINELEQRISELSQSEVESIAVCFLFSFLNPEHERICAQQLRREGYFVSVSSEILPEYREYERTSTTVVNAYVSPVLSKYLSKLESVASSFNLINNEITGSLYIQVMQSNGGIISLDEARRNGARCILSGPAGGVIGAQAVAESLREGELKDKKSLKLITLDMGGTSTDVSLIDGTPQITTEKFVAGCPIRLPLLDIHTIGAGGGSIASIDPGGALRVGPQSAGADPGPACYARTTPEDALPTVTDANLLLGRMSAVHFLGGNMRLDPQRSLVAIARLAAQMGISPQEAALGMIEVVNSHMERALRVISVERGHDPRQFTLLTFGGAGGLHATALAERLGLQRVLVPRWASTLSAYGMLASDIVKDYSLTIMRSGNISYAELANLFEPLVERATQEMNAENVSDTDIVLEKALDMRYVGQSYELSIPFTESFTTEFQGTHQQSYGYSRPDLAHEIVNIRLRAIGKTTSPALSAPARSGQASGTAFLGEREVYLSSDKITAPFYIGENLSPSDNITGPAVVLCVDTTVLVGVDWVLEVDVFGNYVMGIGYAKYS